MTEKEKILQGLLYDASVDELTQDQLAAKELCFAYNRTMPSDETQQRELMRRLLGAAGERFTILAPFWCDYGCNTFMGRDDFAGEPRQHADAPFSEPLKK